MTTDKQPGDRKSIEETRRNVAQSIARHHSVNLEMAFKTKHGETTEQWKRVKIALGMPAQSANDTARKMAEEALQEQNAKDRGPGEEVVKGIEISQSIQRYIRESRETISGETAIGKDDANG